MFADGEVHSRFDGRYDPLDGYRRHIFGDQIVPELWGGPGKPDRGLRSVRPWWRTDLMTGKRKRYSADFKAKRAHVWRTVCGEIVLPGVLPARFKHSARYGKSVAEQRVSYGFRGGKWRTTETETSNVHVIEIFL